MPDPAPQPQEQPPQVPRPPQDAVVQNIVASATPAADTPATPDQLEVHVVLAFPLYFYTLLFCTSSDRFISRPLPSWSFIRFVAPLLVLWYYSASSFYSVFLVLSSFSWLLPSLFQFLKFSAVLCLLHYRVLPSLLHIYSSVAFICLPPAIINLLSPLWHIFQHEMFIICFLMADV